MARRKKRRRGYRNVAAGKLCNTCQGFDGHVADCPQGDTGATFKVTGATAGGGAAETDTGEIIDLKAEGSTGAGVETSELATGLFRERQMSDVRVDPVALAAEADAIAAGHVETDPLVPPPAGEGGEVIAPVSDADTLAGYVVVAEAVVAGAAQSFAPAWAVTPAETHKLADALARACVLWFPDGMIPPKYLALLVVANAGWEIVAAHRDPQTGKLQPRVHIKPAEKELAATH
jgi:hypothetical protein